MYRLIEASSLKTLYFRQFRHNSLLHPCTLCGRSFPFPIGIFNQCRISRYFSTEELQKLQQNVKIPPKKCRTRKKHMELVEVKNDQSKITKARVRSLNASEVKQLSEQSELTIAQFNQIFNKAKNISKTTLDDCRSKLIEPNETVLKSMKLSEINDDALKEKTDEESKWNLIERDTEKVEMYSNSDSQLQSSIASPHVSKILELKIEDDKKSTKTKKRRKSNTEENCINESKSIETNISPLILHPKHSTIKFNQLLASYIDLCVNCDNLNLAFNTIKRYVHIQKTKEVLRKIDKPEVFDSLLHGFASKVNPEKIAILMNWLVEIGVKPSPQSFAANFECYGRANYSKDIIKKLHSLKNDLQSNNYNFNDLMSSCTYINDQREHVLKAIRLVEPDFNYVTEPPTKFYDLPLLEKLNSKCSNYSLNVDSLLTFDDLQNGINEQNNIESQRYCRIKSAVAPKIVTPEIKMAREKWENFKNSVRSDLTTLFIRKLDNLENELKNTRKCYSTNIFPYLKIMPTETFVDLLMIEMEKIMSGSESFSPVIKIIRKNIGREVKLRYDYKMKEMTGANNKFSVTYKEYCKWFAGLKSNSGNINTRHEWQSINHKLAHWGPVLDAPTKPWPDSVVHDIGKFLLNILMNDLSVDSKIINPNKKSQMQPIFHSIFRYQGMYLLEELKPNPGIIQLYKESCQDKILFEIPMLPMVSPPVPWTSVYSGGYLKNNVNLIRIDSFAKNPVITCPKEKMYPILDSLNQLSAVPWKINEQVLNVMLDVFRNGGSRKLNVPLSTQTLMKEELMNSKMTDECTNYDKSNIMKRKSEMYSLWCESLYRLSMADHYRNKIIWFPHNLDFRGRVYPIPPYLTHLGSDLARCLLVFAKGEKLGHNGLNWLKLHCINLTGLKKRESTVARLKYADEILPKIIDSAENPLKGDMWWTESDDMWQILACCMEIKAAIDSGDPENFVSHFPVHQDGSCNGLQHYAALGRDLKGGKSVNLMNSNTPQDVYSSVVELVEAKRAFDAAEGSEIAKALKGHVKRKVIKQTVMTTVYGVTRFGARLQIAKQLKDLDDFPPHLVWSASMYLVKTTFNAISNMFTSTKLIQDWFTECAKFISNDLDQFVEWETPLGLPVCQPYMKETPNVENVYKKRVIKPNTTKQKNAFPPNYIHSLDSTHMMLTSLFCEREGITFVSVHDCYWTHANSVNMMNRICRDQFVALHSQPLLENLSDFFIRKYLIRANDKQMTQHNNKFTKIPEKGELNLDEVIKSEFFFS